MFFSEIQFRIPSATYTRYVVRCTSENCFHKTPNHAMEKWKTCAISHNSHLNIQHESTWVECVKPNIRKRSQRIRCAIDHGINLNEFFSRINFFFSTRLQTLILNRRISFSQPSLSQHSSAFLLFVFHSYFFCQFSLELNGVSHTCVFLKIKSRYFLFRLV